MSADKCENAKVANLLQYCIRIIAESYASVNERIQVVTANEGVIG